MQYELLFDISSQSFHAWPITVGVATLLLLVIVRMVQLRRQKFPVRSWLWMASVLGLTLLLGVMRYQELVGLRNTLASGEAQVVEGVIEGFWTNWPDLSDAQNRKLRAYETFRVGHVQFQYYRDSGDAAFHNGGRQPLAFSSGGRVRIHYAADSVEKGPRNRILKLEMVADDALAARWSPPAHEPTETRLASAYGADPDPAP